MPAQLNIKSEEAHRLASELARLSGASMTEVIVDSLRDRLGRVRYARTSDEERAREKEHGFYDLVVGSRELWKGSMLSLDHGDLLYDEDGLPR